MRTPLSPQEEEAWTYILGYQADYDGVSPSYFEIGKALDYSDKSATGAAREIVRKMAVKGYVSFSKKKFRNIIIIEL